MTRSACKAILAKKIIPCALAVSLACAFSVTPLAFADDTQTADAAATIMEGDGSVDNPAVIAGVEDNVTAEDYEEIVSALYAEAGMSALSVEGDLGTMSARHDSPIVELYGTTKFDTAAAEALYAYEQSEYAIIANGDNPVDALSATALAGALDCPILLTSDYYLPSVTASALDELGVTKPILVGGKYMIDANVKAEIERVCGTNDALRLSGITAIDTQIEIFNYGKENNLWGDTVIVAQGENSYTDALSISPIAYKLHAPIFLASSDTNLSDKSIVALFGGNFTKAIVAGGKYVVSERTMGVLDALVVCNGGVRDDVVRLFGVSLYDTSAEIALWATDQNILTWNKAAFATGESMSDALAGSAVQGVDGSVLLLIDDTDSTTYDAIAQHKSQVAQVKFFGGPYVVSNATRKMVTEGLNLKQVIIYDAIPYTLEQFAQMEVGYKTGCNDGEIVKYLDPLRYDSNSSEFMQFTNLAGGYSGVSAATIDSFIAQRCTYSEQSYGVTSKLRGMGSVFVAAAKKYNVNEVYLVAHAILESAWGCSYYAQGVELDDTVFYNFYGIAAYDSDPDQAVVAAGKYGWNSPENAIMGAAKWINDNYVRSSYNQNTLWRMAWNTNTLWHQYATGVTWQISIARIMDNLYTKHMGRYFSYDELGITYIVPEFAK